MRDDPRQLLLFPEEPHVRQKREIDSLRDQLEKNRRSLHAKHGQLAKLYSEVKHELDCLKSAICKNSGEFRF